MITHFNKIKILFFHYFLNNSLYPFFVNAYQFLLYVWLAVLYEFIWNSNPFYICSYPIVLQKLDDCRAKTPIYGAFLKRDDVFDFFCIIQNQLFVKRLGKSCIYYGCICFQLFCSADSIILYRAYSNDQQIVPFFQN